nr:hypothetical protein [Oedogonium sp. BN3]
MGQKMNPNAIRIAANNQFQYGIFPGGFANIWFSDYKYFTFFYNTFFIQKSKMSIIMKYYKKRVRFLKGRHRRLKSVLRISSVSCLHFPYKKQLLYFVLSPTSMGLQRKHSAFTYNFKKRTPRIREERSRYGFVNGRKKENTLGLIHYKKVQVNVYLNRIKKLAGQNGYKHLLATAKRGQHGCL